MMWVLPLPGSAEVTAKTREPVARAWSSNAERIIVNCRSSLLGGASPTM
ncbi:hypothetical protein ACFSLT_07990 [Novosphingobium resinovorum]